jgi:hypothetical protein
VILSDYHYLICIPLVVAFAELRWLLTNPTELIGNYFSLLKYVNKFDKNMGLKISVNEQQEYEQIQLFLEMLDKQDTQLKLKLDKYLEQEKYRKSFT